MDSSNIEIVESYIYALRDKDLSKIPFASDVVFAEPLTPTLVGVDAVLAYLPNVFPLVKGVQIKRHISEGEYVATLWEVETPMGVIPLFECFRIVGGQIKEISAYFDPRPITNPK